MIKFTFPVDAGNDAIRSRKVEKVFKQIAEELKPEAEYVFPQCVGRRRSLVRNHCAGGVTVRSLAPLNVG